MVQRYGVVVRLGDCVGAGVQPEESLRLGATFFCEMCLVKVAAREEGCDCRIFSLLRSWIFLKKPWWLRCAGVRLPRSRENFLMSTE